jgi:benzoylformate decarboxylase
MRGRRVLMESFVSHDVRHIFGNPGTTETPLLDSLPAFPQLEYIMALHEGVAVSAASFYAQASGRVAVANLHVAPGLGNGIGSLYGALKANSPVVVTAGQQDTRMRLKSPLLGHDLVAMAAPVTKWSVQIERADEIAPVMRRAFKVATDAPQGPVFVSLPIDVMEQETAVDASAPDVEESGHHRRRRRGEVGRRAGAGGTNGSDRCHRVVRRAAASCVLPDQSSELPSVAAWRCPAGA